MDNLQTKFAKETKQKLQSELGITNTMATPQLRKIVLNIGLKDALKDGKLMEDAVKYLSAITGQKPVVTKAKKAIAGFKLRQGDAIGAMVTLRGSQMYDFFEKFTRIVLPRVKDFQGVSTTAFDGHGNYTLGFREMTIFPEIDSSGAIRSVGLQITFNTTAKDDVQTRKLLEMLGMPFKKERR